MMNLGDYVLMFFGSRWGFVVVVVVVYPWLFCLTSVLGFLFLVGI